MDQALRNKLRNVVTRCRRLLEDSIAQQLQGRFGIYDDTKKDGVIIEARMSNLAEEDQAYRQDLIDHFEHIKAFGTRPKDALAQLVREVAFTHLNRLCAYKMMEARDVYVGGQKFREAVSRGINSNGFLFYLAEHPERRAALQYGPSGHRLPPFPRLAGRAALRRDRRPVQPRRPGQPALPAPAGARRGARPGQRRVARRDLVAGRDDRLGLPVFHAQGTAGPGPEGEPGPEELLRAGLPQPVLHAPLRGRVPHRQHAGPHLVRDAEGRYPAQGRVPVHGAAAQRVFLAEGQTAPDDAESGPGRPLPGGTAQAARSTSPTGPRKTPGRSRSSTRPAAAATSCCIASTCC